MKQRNVTYKMQRFPFYCLLPIACCLLLVGCGGPSGLGTGTDTTGGFGGFGNTTAMAAKTTVSPLAASFWQMDKLRAEPKIEVTSESTEKSSTGDVVCREVFYETPGSSGKMLRIFAYYAFAASKKGTKLPAIIIVHGGTGRADKGQAVEWASRGYVALSMDLPGKGPKREASRSEGPDMADDVIFKVSPSPKDSFLYAAVNSVCSAVSALTASKEVDPTRIGVVGSSWGGVITLIANGIDNRITAACTMYGAGYITEDSCWLAHGNLKPLSKKELKSWKDHFDPSSYLTSQYGKTLFVGATQDGYYPLRPFLKTYDRANCAKALCLVPNKSHDVDDAGRGDIAKWFDWALRSGPAFPTVKLAKAGDKLKISATGSRPITAVSLLTADGADFEKATWKPTELTGKDGTWLSDAPKPTVPYFITARDDSGALIAAEVHLPAEKK